jgi:hypothetical protein
MELKLPDKKLLGEDLWFDLSDEIKVRIDYPSRSQEVEQRRLQKVWNGGYAQADSEHWLAYYVRSTLREVVGFTIEGKPAVLIVEKGIARNLSNGEKSLDVVSVLLELDILFSLASAIMSRLEVTEVEKKSSGSQPNSSVMANSEPHGMPSSPVQESSTPSIQSTGTAEKT